MHTQPRDPALLLRAMKALSTCPTGSIRTEQPVEDVRRVAGPFPIPAVDESEGAVKKVFMYTLGALSRLVVTPDCNVIFDYPRLFDPRASNIEAMVGISISCQVIGMMWRGMNGRLSGSARKWLSTGRSVTSIMGLTKAKLSSAMMRRGIKLCRQ